MTLKQALALLGAAVLVCVVVAGGLLLVKAHQDATVQLAAPSMPLASGYLDASGSSATFLDVVSDAHGKVFGIWYGAIASGRAVSAYTGTFSGTISGAQLVLTFTGPGADTDTAALSDGGQVLTIAALATNGEVENNVYHVATVSDYNAAVQALQKASS